MSLSQSHPSRKQVATAVGIVIAVVVVGGIAWAFAQQIVLAQQMQAEEQRLEQLVASEQARNDALLEELAYVRSDAYVEHWARAEAGMAKPGEVTMVLIEEPEGEASGEDERAESGKAEKRPFWAEWWDLFFGTSGP